MAGKSSSSTWIWIVVGVTLAVLAIAVFVGVLVWHRRRKLRRIVRKSEPNPYSTPEEAVYENARQGVVREAVHRYLFNFYQEMDNAKNMPAMLAVKHKWLGKVGRLQSPAGENSPFKSAAKGTIEAYSQEWTRMHD